MPELAPRRDPCFPAKPLVGPIIFLNECGEEHPPLPTLLEGRYGDRIRAAIDDLYRAFASARLSEDFRGCPHCYTESDIEYVRNTPLAGLSNPDMAEIASSLISTLGSPHDVPYFIPRMVEALADGLPVDVEPVVDRIAQVPASSWTADRLTAVRAAFDVLFEAGRSGYAEGGPYDFADQESHDYVRARLAQISVNPDGTASDA